MWEKVRDTEREKNERKKKEEEGVDWKVSNRDSAVSLN